MVAFEVLGEGGIEQWRAFCMWRLESDLQNACPKNDVVIDGWMGSFCGTSVASVNYIIRLCTQNVNLLFAPQNVPRMQVYDWMLKRHLLTSIQLLTN